MKRCGWLLCSQVLLVAVCSSARTAQADARSEQRSVLVLAPNANEQAQFRAQVLAGVARAGLEVAAQVGEDFDGTLVACRALGCVAQAARSAHTAYALWVQVDVDTQGRATRVHLQLGNSADASAQSDAVVTGADVAGAVAEAIANVRRAISLGDDALLRVVTRPTGGILYIDGAVAGSAPSEHRVRAGKHVVSATLSGFVGDQREVVVTAGQVTQLQMTFVAVARPASAQASSDVSDWNYVAGALLWVAAAPLIALPLDALANDNRCSSKLDAPSTCVHESHFDAWGGVALASGVVALAGGSYLIFATPFQLDAQVSSRGAALAVRGRM